MKRIFLPTILLLICSFAFADERSVEGLRLQARHARPEEAIKLLKKAIKTDEKCIECWADIVQPYRKLGAYKDAANAGRKIVELASNDAERARGHLEIGWSYALEGDVNKKQGNYADAEREFREALKFDDAATLHFFLGRVLLNQSRDPEGLEELKKALSMKLPESYKQQAERFIENPRRAREPFVPDFSFTTLDGRYLTNDDLTGKIVVLDFWGTWCPPCVHSVPEMRNLAAHFRNQPDVLILSISTDADEDKLRTFVLTNKMEWPQTWDKNRSITKAFGVNSFPTYLVVDRDGLMKRVEHGGGGNRLGIVEEEVNRLLKDSKKRAETKVATGQ